MDGRAPHACYGDRKRFGMYGRTSEGVSEWRNRTGEVIEWHLEYLRHMSE